MKLRLNLHTKISLLISVVAVSIGAISFLFVSRIMIAVMREGLKAETRIIAKALGERVLRNVLREETIPAREALLAAVAEIPDLEYAYIVGFNKEMFVHTFGKKIPRQFFYHRHDKVPFREYNAHGKLFLDFVCPLVEGLDAHLHVGFNESSIIANIAGMRDRIVVITFFLVLIGIGIGLVVSYRLMNPLKNLSAELRMYGEGKEVKEISVEGADEEVNGLVSAYNLMISSREKAITELRESEEKYRQLVETMNEGLVVQENQKLTYVNDSFCKMLGYSRDELAGREIIALFDEENQKKFKEQKGLRKKGVDAPYEIEFLAKGGGKICTIISPGSLKLDGETLKGSSATVTDITGRKKAEVEREQLIAKLESKNEELNQFSYAVSHDLRAPLRSMAGFSKELMKRSGDSLDPEAQDYLDRIRRGAVRMGSIIDSLLKLSRISREKLKLKTVDLSSIAESIFDVLKADESGRDIEIVIEKGLKVEADEDMMKIIMENLINNAWKFTGKEKTSRIEFRSKKSSGKEVFFVKDNGSGFSMEYADKLFIAFQRLHRDQEFPGLGIGLATVQRCVNLHGGRIWAESEQGKGSVFYFAL